MKYQPEFDLDYIVMVNEPTGFLEWEPAGYLTVETAVVDGTTEAIGSGEDLIVAIRRNAVIEAVVRWNRGLFYDGAQVAYVAEPTREVRTMAVFIQETIMEAAKAVNWH